jgi:hypothetical protein
MPPEELKSRVMKEVGDADRRTDQSNNAPGPAKSGSNWMGTVLLILLVGASLFLYRGKAAAERDLASLESRYNLFQEDCERQKARLMQQQQVFATLNHEATIPVRLHSAAGAKEGINAEAIAYLNGLEKVAYINAGLLPAPPSGKTYQLWADVEGEMINMGVLNMEHKGLQAVTYIDHAESLNITVEPKGGSEKPTVELLIANGEV